MTTDTGKRLLNIVKKYFEAWNKHDLNNLKELFDDKIVLKDWEIKESGIENVLRANEKIFKENPEIQIQIESVCINTDKIMAQIKVFITKENTIDVVDVFSIKNNLISDIKAYKC